MNTFELTEEITVFYVKASSFPQGIQAAFDDLDGRLPNPGSRVYFGLSYCGTEGIVYMAAVQETYAGEGHQYGCETHTIGKGTYLYRDLKDWRIHIDKMSGIFDDMVADPRFDTPSLCIEWYIADDVRCMVRMQS